jgi:hypothetical protein
VDFNLYNVLAKFPIEEVHKKTFGGGALVSPPLSPLFFFFWGDITKLGDHPQEIHQNLAIDQR